MFRAFQVQIPQWNPDPNLHKAATALGGPVERDIETLLAPGRVVDGSLIQETWFPQVNAQIFISHAHADEAIALNLAGWLKTKLGLDAFVDSRVWGQSKQLQRAIDNRHCYDPIRDIYDYDKRNGTTGHVHMMLTTALAQMIDRAECLFFINTPNSITTSPKDAASRTHSPWIFAELALMKLLRKPHPRGQFIKMAKSMTESVERRADFKPLYDTEVDALPTLGWSTFKEWRARREMFPRAEYALDTLYELMPEG